MSIGLIEIKGLEKTKPDLIQPLISPCLAARTFGDLSQCLHSSMDKMQRLNIFKNLNVTLDKLDDAEDTVKVTIDAEEKKLRLHVGTEVQKNDVAFSLKGQLFNLFGRAETLDASASIGEHTTAPLQLSFTKPLNGDPDKILNLACGSTASKYPGGVKYCHSSNSASASLKTPSWMQDSFHEFKYAADWRTIYGISPEASPSIRRSAGHSLKSAISHIWSMNTRDDHVFPSSGCFLRWNQELAGGFLGGDPQHFKQDLFASWHLGIFSNVTFSVSARAGHVMSLTDKKVFLLDRFQMGGPNSVRGFQTNSIGPKDLQDSLGGDMAMEAGASLAFPIKPSLSHVLRGQLFANVGMLGLTNSKMSIRDTFRQFINDPQPSASIGAGLLVKLSPTTRLELNISKPVTALSGEVHSGVQLGLGIEFL